MFKLIKQLKEFFKPFPEPDSWAYNMHMFFYDLVIAFAKPIVGDLGYSDVKVYPPRKIEFETLEEAMDVLSDMKKVIERHGYSTVSDLYFLAGLDPDFTDGYIGWIKLDEVSIKKLENGKYWIDFPRTSIVNLGRKETENGDNHEESIDLDTPTYLRRDGNGYTGGTNGSSSKNGSEKPTDAGPDESGVGDSK